MPWVASAVDGLGGRRPRPARRRCVRRDHRAARRARGAPSAGRRPARRPGCRPGSRSHDPAEDAERGEHGHDRRSRRGSRRATRSRRRAARAAACRRSRGSMGARGGGQATRVAALPLGLALRVLREQARLAAQLAAGRRRGSSPATRVAWRRLTGSRRARTRTVWENRVDRPAARHLVVVLERLGDQVDGPRQGEDDEDECAEVHAIDVRSGTRARPQAARCVGRSLV